MGILNNITCLIASSAHGAAGAVHDGGMLSEWAFTAPLAAFFVLLFALCVFVTKWRRAMFAHLKWIAATVFIVGIVLYFMGFNWEGSEGNVLTLLLRATVSSIEMFVSETDLLEVEHSLKYNHVYMTIFAITHFSAVFVSAIVILRVFGLRLLSMLRLLTKVRYGGRLYVFWNIDDNSLTVAESIERRPGDLIVFVNVPYGHHGHHSSRFTFSHFFHTADDGVEQYVGRIEALGAIILAAKGKPDMVKDDAKALDFFRRLGLKRLEKVLPRYESVEFFFLSNDERNNIEALGALKRYAAIDNAKHIREDAFNAYCHARRNRFNENLLGCKGLEYRAHLIDSSSLAALQLKRNDCSVGEHGNNHPVNFVDVDTETATVSSVFTALVIGFGETGSDVFKFLYEFSSFIKSSATGNDGFDEVTEQERKIYVSDIRLDSLKTEFLENVPALVGSRSVEWLDGMTTRTPQFWNKLSDIIDALNYVVISIDDDDEALSIAIRLFDFAYRYRRNMDKFKIYVRLRKYGDKLLVDGIGRYTVDGRRILEVFGTNCEIFSYDNVSAVSKEAEAKDFYFQYSLTTVGIDGSMTAEAKRNETERLMKLQPEGLWRNRRKKADGSIENTIKIEYQEEQDRSNVDHIYTKLALAGVYDEQGRVQLDRLKHLVTVTTRNDENEYVNASAGTDKLLFDNLCYCEHFRWNSKMELQGFVFGESGKDFKRKIHHCIVSCNDLIRKEDTKKTFIYDQGTVELSFKKMLQLVSQND